MTSVDAALLALIVKDAGRLLVAHVDTAEAGGLTRGEDGEVLYTTTIPRDETGKPIGLLIRTCVAYSISSATKEEIAEFEAEEARMETQAQIDAFFKGNAPTTESIN